MNAVVPPAVPARPAVRSTAASPATLVGVEVRKSLSSRSGKALVGAAVLLPSIAMGLATTGEGVIGGADGPVGAMGLLTGMLLLAVGIVSTAGEWSHRTVQTTFLLVPRRGRVLAAKAVAMGLLGAAVAALATAASTGVLWVTLGSDLSWDGVPRAMAVLVAAGAVFAGTGAGIGAALANAPAALTVTYLTVLGAVPVLGAMQPGIAPYVDPNGAVLALAQGQETTQSVLVLAGWVVVAGVAGAVATRRRAVA
ncbi:ABC transporter permease subunit [Geodermatophilus sp. CPCC 205761]|uniref:ABC transporter permease subunit n=1 Tax=Geodermatophilus sp. CPCC 205761 TaxID=2936597 RepID=UPI003EEED02C